MSKQSKIKKQRKLNQSHDSPKSTFLDLSQPRDWTILGYNPHTDTYLIESIEGKSKIISCLKCCQKLKEGSVYKGYKDEKKYLQIIQLKNIDLDTSHAC